LPGNERIQTKVVGNYGEEGQDRKRKKKEHVWKIRVPAQTQNLIGTG